MTVECITVLNNHLFPGNPLAEQFQLRYRAIKQRQAWDVPEFGGMEYDQYDNPATTYLIWRDETLKARGVSRLYPTDRPFMLADHFGHMVSGAPPSGPGIMEASRLCIDNDLTSGHRQRIARELILAYLEYGLEAGVRTYVGIMYPIYWKRLFTDAGWEPFWLGEVTETPDGKRSRAGGAQVSHAVLRRVRAISDIHQPVLKRALAKDMEHAA